MNAMQAVATSGRSSALLPLCKPAPLGKQSSSSLLRGVSGLKRECQGVRLKCETRSRRVVEARAEAGEDYEDRDAGISAGASSSGVPSVLYSVAPLMILADATGYSQASYNTTLGLFLLSLPGVWSLVKRATKSKVCDDDFLVYFRAQLPGLFTLFQLVLEVLVSISPRAIVVFLVSLFPISEILNLNEVLA